MPGRVYPKRRRPRRWHVCARNKHNTVTLHDNYKYKHYYHHYHIDDHIDNDFDSDDDDNSAPVYGAAE